VVEVEDGRTEVGSQPNNRGAHLFTGATGKLSGVSGIHRRNRFALEATPHRE
jgi:hypothetical protein